MSGIDWIILIVTLSGIILYGIYKSRTTKNLEGYFLSNRSLPWYLVLLSIMGTQASAITFLTGPGQAYSDGMRFVNHSRVIVVHAINVRPDLYFLCTYCCTYQRGGVITASSF